jgi:pimeloyl-ACP methyl ester carboxylesterase
VVAGVTVVCAAMACSDPIVVDPPGPRPHDARTFVVPAGQSAFPALFGATAFHGTHDGIHGPASYRIEVPDTWNGVLVMYAHGYRGTGSDLLVSSPAPDGLRAHLIANDYAWAASSYSANYYDVRSGVEDTNALALEFAALTGRASPTKLYVVGRSMGGHVAAAAVEQETLERASSLVAYAASMPMCGVMADNELGDYYHALNLAAHELAGITVTSFPVTDFATSLPLIEQSLWVDYDADPFGLTAQGEKFKHVFVHLSGGPRPTFEEDFPRDLDRLFERGSEDGTWNGILPGVGTNTTDIVYQLDADPSESSEEAAFNASVFRVEGDFLAHNPPRSDGVRAMPIVEGRIGVPVLSVHTLESRVPFRMQQIYAERVASHGNSSRLVQRVIRSGVHCDFTADESVASFDALVDWEVNGTVPAGDDVLDPTVVAHPDYGCTFTTATRPGMPACP